MHGKRSSKQNSRPYHSRQCINESLTWRPPCAQAGGIAAPLQSQWAAKPGRGRPGTPLCRAAHTRRTCKHNPDGLYAPVRSHLWHAPSHARLAACGGLVLAIVCARRAKAGKKVSARRVCLRELRLSQEQTPALVKQMQKGVASSGRLVATNRASAPRHASRELLAPALGGLRAHL